LIFSSAVTRPENTEHLAPASENLGTLPLDKVPFELM